MAGIQRTAFKTGCYLAFFTAALHMVGQVAGGLEPADQTQREVLELATNHRFAFPGGVMRSLMDLQIGFSLVFAVLTALSGGLGLIVVRRAVADELLMRATARAMAGAYLVLLAISLTHFFIVPTMCFLAIAAAFSLAAFTRA